jgi:hypothetical protein
VRAAAARNEVTQLSFEEKKPEFPSFFFDERCDFLSAVIRLIQSKAADRYFKLAFQSNVPLRPIRLCYSANFNVRELKRYFLASEFFCFSFFSITTEEMTRQSSTPDSHRQMKNCDCVRKERGVKRLNDT